MLWSLVKIVVFVVLVAAATFGASYLLDMQGGVLIAMGGIEINLTPIKAVIAALLLILAVWLFLKLFGLLTQPTEISDLVKNYCPTPD